MFWVKYWYVHFWFPLRTCSSNISFIRINKACFDNVNVQIITYIVRKHAYVLRLTRNTQQLQQAPRTWCIIIELYTCICPLYVWVRSALLRWRIWRLLWIIFPGKATCLMHSSEPKRSTREYRSLRRLQGVGCNRQS